MSTSRHFRIFFPNREYLPRTRSCQYKNLTFLFLARRSIGMRQSQTGVNILYSNHSWSVYTPGLTISMAVSLAVAPLGSSSSPSFFLILFRRARIGPELTPGPSLNITSTFDLPLGIHLKCQKDALFRLEMAITCAYKASIQNALIPHRLM